jgi:HEAT repeat protein
VVERREEKTEGVRTVPLWQAAITFLGIAKDKKAVPALIGILEDEAAGLDALIGAVRSLGRIGASSAIPALRNFLKRENIPAERVMNSGMRAIEDAKWQIELTVAEALSQLGAPKDEVRKIIEPYLNDQRAYVRRYAKKLL